MDTVYKMNEENLYIMWLNAIIELNPKQKEDLITAFGSAKAVFEANSHDIKSKININSDDLYKITSAKTKQPPEKHYEDLVKSGSRFISYLDNDYPYLLSEIPCKPLGLYIIGDMPTQEYKIAIVGSRRCTEYGHTVSYNIAKKLVQSDICIVSGMAEGIDSSSHNGALDGGGKTIAVMGTGIDICYPKYNRKLRERIIENGCILSEYPPGVHGTPYTFPRRNRIISGLSQGVIIVEAAKRSGSSITVNHALDQGRDVFAVPGNITSAHSIGSNQMIKDGAIVLLSADDVLDYYNIKKNEKKNKNKPKPSLDETENSVYNYIDLVPQSIEELAAKTGMDTSELQSTLTMLELDGAVQKLSGQRYVRSQ